MQSMIQRRFGSHSDSYPHTSTLQGRGCTVSVGSLASWLGLALIASVFVWAPTGSSAAAEAPGAWQFDRGEKWRVWFSRDKPKPDFDSAYDAEGWVVTLPPSDASVSLPCFASAIKDQQWLKDLQAFTLRVDLVSGEKAAVLVTFRDEEGKQFTLNTRKLEPGSNEVVWNLPQDGKAWETEPSGGLTLFNLRVQRPRDAGDQPVRVRLREAVPTMFVPIGNELAIDLETGDPLHLLKPDSGQAPWLEITNQTDRRMRLSVQTAVTDRYASTPQWGETQRLDVRPGQSGRIDYPQAAGANLGCWYGHWRIELPDGRHTQGVSSYAVMDPVGKTPGIEPDHFVFGTAGFHREWSSPRERAELISHAAAIMGAESNRFGTQWRATERNEGEYDWSYLDRLVEITLADGMEPQLLVSFGGAEWTKTPEVLARAEADGQMNRQWRYPPRLDKWRVFVRAVAERYKGRIRLYEIWNEPDIGFFRGTSEEYVELLKAAYEEIKSVDPDAIVISGGMASIEHQHAKLDLYDMLFGEDHEIYDWFGYHRHGPFDSFERDLRQLFSRRQAAGGPAKTLYFNETGYSRDRPSEYDMAEALVKKLPYSWSLGATGYHWFCMWVPESSVRSSAYGYRMFHEDFTPRPVYVAHNTLARYLRGKKYSHALDLGQGRFGFVFHGQGVFTGSGDRDYVVIHWTEDRSLAPGLMALEIGGAESIRQVSLMGTESTVAQPGSFVAMDVQHEPSLLIIEGANISPREVEPLVLPSPGVTLSRAEPATASILVRNPTEAPMKLIAEWGAVGGIEFINTGNQQDLITVESGETAELSREFRISPSNEQRGGVVGHASIRWALGDTLNQETRDLEIPFREAIPLSTAATNTPTFRLDRADQVVNNSDIDPDMFAYRWLGPEDLSASVWLTAIDDGLRLRVEVTDDVHNQPQDQRNLWKGDSLQIGIATDDRDGFWELGVGRTNDGRSSTYVWGAPVGADRSNSPISDVRVDRSGTTTSYTVDLNLGSGVSENSAKFVMFNLIANDSDGGRFREGYIGLAPGIASAKSTAQFIPVLLP